MKKSILEIYAFAVCFFSLICFVISLCIASSAVIQIANPGFTMSKWQYSKYQSNDAFWSAYTDNGKKEQQRPEEAELSRRRHQEFSLDLIAEQRDGIQTLVQTLIIMLINLAVFSFHWMMARKSVRMKEA